MAKAVKKLEGEAPQGKIIPLIMCGGAGTRLWPASREGRPKQFLRLFGDNSTFQETVLRTSDQSVFDRPIVVTNAAYRFMVLEQLNEIGVDADILLEPARRDSGPAVAAGAVFALTRNKSAVVLALAAVHIVGDREAVVQGCRQALTVAADGFIVTFGVRPTRPAVEYGYILPGKAITKGTFSVSKFVEKPDLATAQKYVQQGYLWNSGNFMFPATTLVDEYRITQAEGLDAVSASIENAKRDLGFISLDADAFGRAKAISIDYAVMEHTSKAAVVPVSYDWSDVGSWRAVWELSEKDKDGNSAKGDVFFEDVRNCEVMSESAVVALEGVENLVVIATKDAILISGQKDAKGFRRLVDRLKVSVPQVTEDHPVVYRPWGSYQSLDIGTRHQVKRIVVKPGGRLSLQKHYHRSEHWIVVRGTAVVTINELIKTVHENESIYIPIGSTHRMENPGKIPLELIEVQTGSYLGEDDIIRIQDDYSRS